MSHFTVLVVGNDPEEQLYPFNEQPPHGSELLKFNNVEETERPKYDTGTQTKVKSPTGELFSPWDEKFRKQGQYGIGTGTHEVPEGYTEVEIPFKQLYSTFEEYISEYCGYEKDEETGTYGYYHNPRAKWDWYELGGRWTGYFKMKDGAAGERGRPGLMTNPAKAGYADQALKGDIDFEGMIADSVAEAEANWEKAQLTADARDRYWNFGVRDETKEAYVKRCSSLTTFALIKDGEWYEKGEMGWWGIVTDEKEQDNWEEEFAKMLAGLPDDTLLSVYDCHI